MIATGRARSLSHGSCRALVALLAFAACTCVQAQGVEVDDPLASDPALRAFTESMHGNAYALEIGRIAYRKRWNALLDDLMYVIAPRGTWDPKHPAWAPARAALADVMTRRVAPRYAAYVPAARRLMNQASTRLLTPEERAAATAFFNSPAGRAFMEARARSAATDAFGVPPGPDAATQAQLKATSDRLLDGLDHLPPADAKALDDFLESPLWKKVLHLQLDEWADTTSFFINESIQEVAREALPAVAAEVRAALPATARIPPPSSKTYLGTLTLAPDGHFDVVVEHFKGLYRMGRYALRYARDAPQSRDLAAMAPGIAAGETRYLYFDAQYRVSDHP